MRFPINVVFLQQLYAVLLRCVNTVVSWPIRNIEALDFDNNTFQSSLQFKVDMIIILEMSVFWRLDVQSPVMPISRSFKTDLAFSLTDQPMSWLAMISANKCY
jgi:hypothetical protein